MRLRLTGLGLLVVYVVALGALLGAGARQSGDIPPFPNNFEGRVFINGQPAPDGMEIFARLDRYQSNVARPNTAPGDRPIALVENGAYENVKVQPLDSSSLGRTITFYATFGRGEVQAQETAVFVQANPQTFEGLFNVLDLNFAEAPAQATPTPTPVPPTPTSTPGLPITGDPSVPQMSRTAVLAGIGALAVGAAMLVLIRRRNALRD